MTPARVAASDLHAGFIRLGMRPGDSVLVHSSLSRFGHVEGGAVAVIEALRRLLGADGTLLMSAITTTPAFVNACIGAAERDEVAPVRPFDVTADPTWAGTIAETFRTLPGVVRSWHPTHSLSAWGARADDLIAGHADAPGPCGEGTPYARLCALERGFILLLGVSHQSNTVLHGMEELAGVEYVLHPAPVRIPIITPQGPALARTRVHLPSIGRHLGALETAYIDAGAQTVTRIGDSTVRLVAAGRMRDLTLQALAADPFRLLDARGLATWQALRAGIPGGGKP